MSVTQLVRSTQLKPGTANRVLVNGAAATLADLTALAASSVILSDSNGLPTTTGTITAEKLSYLDIGSSLTSLLGGKLSLTGGTMSGAIAMGTNKITGLGDPTAAQDAATLSYVDSVVHGFSVHAACHVATTAPLAVTPAGSGVGKTLTFNVGGLVSIDGHELVLDDRVLVKNQVGSIDNGIYKVTNAGTAPTSAVASDIIAEGSPTFGDTITFTGLPTDGTRTFTYVETLTDPTSEFTTFVGYWETPTVMSLSSLINAQLTDVAAAYSAYVFINTVTSGSSMNSATITGTGTWSGLDLTFSGGLDGTPVILTRATDLDGSPASEVTTGDFTLAQLGTINGGSGWVISSGHGVIVVDTDEMIWTEFSDVAGLTGSTTVAVNGTTVELGALAPGYLFIGDGAGVSGMPVSGEATLSDVGNWVCDNAAVIAKPITGYVIGTSQADVTTSTSIVDAISIISGNDSLKLPLTGGVLTGALTLGDETNQLNIGTASGSITTIHATAQTVTRTVSIPVIADPHTLASSTFLLSGEKAIVSTDFAANAGILFTQLNGLPAGEFFVGQGSGAGVAVSMSQDATMTSAGVVTLASSFLRDSKYIVRAIPTGDINSSNLEFTLTDKPVVSGTEHVFLNGVLQSEGSGKDYTIGGTDNAVITFEAGNAPPTGSVLLVSYYKS